MLNIFHYNQSAEHSFLSPLCNSVWVHDVIDALLVKHQSNVIIHTKPMWKWEKRSLRHHQSGERFQVRRSLRKYPMKPLRLHLPTRTRCASSPGTSTALHLSYKSPSHPTLQAQSLSLRKDLFHQRLSEASSNATISRPCSSSKKSKSHPRTRKPRKPFEPPSIHVTL